MWKQEGIEGTSKGFEWLDLDIGENTKVQAD